MTEGEERREHIIKLLTQTKKPISGTELARQMKVSRQVIVQDIALLRASNRNILSTRLPVGRLQDNRHVHFQDGGSGRRRNRWEEPLYATDG